MPGLSWLECSTPEHAAFFTRAFLTPSAVVTDHLVLDKDEVNKHTGHRNVTPERWQLMASARASCCKHPAAVWCPPGVPPCSWCPHVS